MFQIIGHTGRCRADFTKLVAPKFFALNYTGSAALVPADSRLHQLHNDRLEACGTATVGLRDFLQIYFRERYQYFVRFVLTFPPYKKIYF